MNQSFHNSVPFIEADQRHEGFQLYHGNPEYGPEHY